MSALRDTEGKLNWVLLFEHFPLALKELCRAREFGARHYTKDGKDGATNWRDSINGPEHEKFYKGCIRGSMSHKLKTLWGEDRDTIQDNVHHLGYACLNDLMALEYALAKELDDKAHAVPEGGSTPREPELFNDRGVKKFDLWPAKKTIYDWSNIPKEFNWAAKDKNEIVYLHDIKPSLGEEEWNQCSKKFAMYSQETDEPWWTSLEARPT